MSARRAHQTLGERPPTVAELEHALVFTAYIVTKYGAVYTPIFERVETELELARRAEDPMVRARRLLDAHTRDGGLRAIS